MILHKLSKAGNKRVPVAAIEIERVGIEGDVAFTRVEWTPVHIEFLTYNGRRIKANVCSPPCSK
jgi:hypothetical protein